MRIKLFKVRVAFNVAIANKSPPEELSQDLHRVVCEALKQWAKNDHAVLLDPEVGVSVEGVRNAE